MSLQVEMFLKEKGPGDEELGEFKNIKFKIFKNTSVFRHGHKPC
jgi:hypothetical protein